MKLPSIQLLQGVLDPTSDMLLAAREIGVGRPQPNADQLVFNRPATKIDGDYGLVVDSPNIKFDGTPWTLQYYGRISSAVRIMASKDYPAVVGEFSMILNTTTMSIYLTYSPRATARIAYAEIPIKLRGGFRHYKITYSTGFIKIYVDGTLVANFAYQPKAPSNKFCIFGEQRGKDNTLVIGSSTHAELVRLDWGYVVPATEDYKFKSQESLDIARSNFEQDQVKVNQFNFLRIQDIFNYSPEPNDADIDAGTKVVPPMVTNTVGTFTVSASSYFGDSFPPRAAFNSYPVIASSQAWVTGNGAASDLVPHWLQMTSTTKMKFNSYRLTDRWGGSGRILSWTLEGRNTGDVVWTKIHQVTDDQSTDTTRRYMVGTQNWDQVRLRITKNAVNTVFYAAVGNLQFMWVETKSSKKGFRYTDGSFTITDTPVNTDVGNHITDVTRAPKAGMKFNRYEVENRTWANTASIASPKTWTLQGRDNLVDAWTDIHTVASDTNNVSGVVRGYDLGQTYMFKYVRLSITANNGGNAFTSVGELRLMLDGVSILPAINSNDQPPYTVAGSSYYTANGTFPEFMAFNNVADGGWVSASAPTSGSPQWIEVFANIDVTEVVVSTSDGRTLNAGAVNDIDPPWIYPQGSGYLIDDAGTLKFIPFIVEGLLEVIISGVPYYLFESTVAVPMSPENLVISELTAANNVSYNPGYTASAWKTLPFNAVLINGVAATVTNGGFVLPAGKYYGRAHINGYKCNSFVAKFRDEAGNTLDTTPSGYSSANFTGLADVVARVYFEVLVDTTVYLDVYAEATNVASASANTLFITPQVIASLNLFRVG